LDDNSDDEMDERWAIDLPIELVRNLVASFGRQLN
jgi:hypothetical protein